VTDRQPKIPESRGVPLTDARTRFSHYRPKVTVWNRLEELGWWLAALAVLTVVGCILWR